MKKLFDTINSFNKYVGFTMYSILGILIPISHVMQQFWFGLQKTDEFDLVKFILSGYYFLIFLLLIIISLIIWIIEYALDKKLESNFFTKNVPFKILKYIGAIISTIFISFITIFCIYNIS